MSNKKCLKSLSKRDGVQTTRERKQSRIFLTAEKWRYALVPTFSAERGVKFNTHSMVKLKNSSCYRIRPGKLRKRRLASGFELATYPTRGDVDASALANWAIRPSWAPRNKCLYDSQSIVSALAWKRLCKRRTKHHKIADISQSGTKWQKKRMRFQYKIYWALFWYTTEWWCLVTFFSGIRKLCILFFFPLWCL